MSKRGFHFLTGDTNWLDYGGSWYREIPGSKGMRFHVLRFDNWNEYESDPKFQYLVDLSEIDLASIPDETIKSALQSCGWEHEDDLTTLMIVEACCGYGARAPLYDESGNNSRALIRAAKRCSYELTSNPDAYEEAMDRPVNRLGSTAREFMQGDLDSALLRGLATGDPTADLMARIMLGKRTS